MTKASELREANTQRDFCECKEAESRRAHPGSLSRRSKKIGRTPAARRRETPLLASFRHGASVGLSNSERLEPALVGPESQRLPFREETYLVTERMAAPSPPYTIDKPRPHFGVPSFEPHAGGALRTWPGWFFTLAEKGLLLALLEWSAD